MLNLRDILNAIDDGRVVPEQDEMTDTLSEGIRGLWEALNELGIQSERIEIRMPRTEWLKLVRAIEYLTGQKMILDGNRCHPDQLPAVTAFRYYGFLFVWKEG